MESKIDLYIEAEKVIKSYPEKLKAYKEGKKDYLFFFSGELMNATKGMVPPGEIQMTMWLALDQECIKS